MKFSFIPLAVASAGLLASASPMRVVIVSSGVETTDGPVAHMERPVFRLRPAAEAATGVAKPHSAPCGGSRFRQKISSISSAFKIALGFSVSDKKDGHGHELRPITPLPFIGTPNANGLEGETQGGDRLRIMPISAHPHPERIHAHRFRHRGKHSFLMRVHFALMSLGPWEGRAVAFVLGCGIGVLLRMFWVMAVISYRLVRGQRPVCGSTSQDYEEHEYTVVDLDAEEIFVAPPQYTYPVEKTEVAAIPVPVESN
ncbi:hypothetical protein B0H11DRAFT_644121 [Mycena galericulata]|nr:hypothetical protein B0H11DRAFT_644121 [Mycena galericulata]